MNSRFSAIAAGLLLAVAAPCSNAAVPATPSLVATVLNTLPVLGPTVIGVVATLGQVTARVPVAGPALAGLLVAPASTDNGPLSLSGVVGALPGLGQALGGAVGGVGSVARGVPVAGPLLGSMIGTLTPEQMPPLQGLPGITNLVNGLPVVGPVLSATVGSH